MRRVRISQVIVALVTAALVVAGGLYLVQFAPILLSKDSGTEMLAAWARENLDAEVEAGWIAPVTFPGPGIQVRDLELRAKTKSGSTELFSAKSIKVVADSSELIFNRRVVWKEIIIDSPRVYLARNPDKSWNIVNWAKNVPIKKKAQAAKAEETGETSLAKWAAKDYIRGVLPHGRDEWVKLLVLQKIEIRNAYVHAVDRAAGKKALLAPLSLGGINLKLTGASLRDPVNFSLSLPFPQGGGVKSAPLSLGGSLALGEDLDHPSLRSFSLSGGWEGVRIHSVAGSARFKPASFNASVNLTFSYPSFYRIVTWAPIAHSKTLPYTTGSGVIDVKVKISGLDPKKPFKVHYTGEAVAHNVTFGPGRVIAPIEGFDGTIKLEDGRIIIPPVTVTVGGSVLRGRGTIIEQKAPRFELDLESDRVDFGKFFMGRRLSAILGRMLPMRTEWGGPVKLDEGFYHKMRFLDGSGRWEMKTDRVLRFPELAFNSCGGSYTESGRSYVDFNHLSEYRFRFDGKIRGMDLEQFVDQIFGTSIFLKGNTNADGYVTGKFMNSKFHTRSLDGNLELDLGPGRFAEFNPFGKALEMMRAPVPAALRDMNYQTMRATVVIRSGVGQTGNLIVEAPGMKGYVKGYIDFVSKQVDLKIKIVLLSGVSDAFEGLPILGEPVSLLGRSLTTLYVRAHGHWDYLSYSAWNPLDESAPEPPPEAETAPRDTASP